MTDVNGYVIVGPLDPFDAEPLYWSNELGWVSRGEATVFTREERNGTLPMDAVGWEMTTASPTKAHD